MHSAARATAAPNERVLVLDRGCALEASFPTLATSPNSGSYGFHPLLRADDSSGKLFASHAGKRHSGVDKDDMKEPKC